jgi:hypothetical protein
VCYSTYSLNTPDYSLNIRPSYFDALQPSWILASSPRRAD